jgi:hypothetical protein
MTSIRDPIDGLLNRSTWARNGRVPKAFVLRAILDMASNGRTEYQLLFGLESNAAARINHAGPRQF